MVSDNFVKTFFDKDRMTPMVTVSISKVDDHNTYLNVLREKDKFGFCINIPYIVDCMYDYDIKLFSIDDKFTYLLFVIGEKRDVILILNVNNMTYTSTRFLNCSNLQIDSINKYSIAEVDCIDVVLLGNFDKFYDSGNYYCKFSAFGIDNFDHIFKSGEHALRFDTTGLGSIGTVYIRTAINGIYIAEPIDINIYRNIKAKRNEDDTMINNTKNIESESNAKKANEIKYTNEKIILKHRKHFDDLAHDAIHGSNGFVLLNPTERITIAAKLDDIISVLDSHLKENMK